MTTYVQCYCKWTTFVGWAHIEKFCYMYHVILLLSFEFSEYLYNNEGCFNPLRSS